MTNYNYEYGIILKSSNGINRNRQQQLDYCPHCIKVFKNDALENVEHSSLSPKKKLMWSNEWMDGYYV
jgi:hypothetical protein